MLHDQCKSGQHVQCIELKQQTRKQGFELVWQNVKAKKHFANVSYMYILYADWSKIDQYLLAKDQPETTLIVRQCKNPELSENFLSQCYDPSLIATGWLPAFCNQRGTWWDSRVSSEGRWSGVRPKCFDPKLSSRRASNANAPRRF